MLGRDVERGEIVEIVLDMRPLGDDEAHLAEDRDDLVDGLADRMDAARRRRASTGRVTSTRSAASRFGERGAAEPVGRAASMRRGDRVLQRVERGAGVAPLVGGQARRGRASAAVIAPLAAEQLDADLLERVRRWRCRDLAETRSSDLLRVVHDRS